MKRIFTKIGMVVAMLLTFLQASAYDFEVDGIYYDIISFTDFTCKVVSGDNEYEGDIIIPSKVEYNNREVSVVGIGNSAFSGCSSLISVTIPESVTEIGGSAFSGCSSLTSVTIPDSVTKIYGSAFEKCSSLTSVTIPDSVTSIGDGAFSGCSSLISVTIPDSVTEIGDSAFKGCSSLTSVTIPASVTKIGSSVFSGCSSLTSITISDSVTSIGVWAFSGCSSLTSVTIPDSVTLINSGAFEKCSSLTSITIPDSVTVIGMSVFSGCSSLTSVTISDSVTSIGEDAFYGCSSLSSVYLSSNLKQIRNGLFNGCSQLDKLAIPGSVERIEMYYDTLSPSSWTFGNCDNLKEMEILWNTTPLEFGYYDDWRRFCLHTSYDIFISGKETKLPLEKVTIDRELKWKKSDTPLPYLKEYIMGEHLTKNQVDLSKSEQLESITCYASNPPTLGSITNAQYMNVIVRVPEEYLEAYKQANGWKNFWNLQGFSGVDEVKNDAAGKYETGRYNLSGQQVGEDYDGIVIIRFSDGSSKKVAQKR